MPSYVDFNNTKITLWEKEPMPANNQTKFTDQEVLAAINSCINLLELNKIPVPVITRFRELMKHKRVGAVCFFLFTGFGLKVYNDDRHVTTGSEVTDDELDETSVQTPAMKDGRLNLDGYWVKCPKELYAAKQEDPKIFTVMDDRATKFIKQIVDENTEEILSTDWTGNRPRAGLYTKEQAEKIAKTVNGVVVKK